MAKKELIYKYQLGNDYQIELVNNMLYYKKRNSFNDFDLVKAEEVPSSMYGHSELKEHATDIAKKMGLSLTNAITGSAV